MLIVVVAGAYLVSNTHGQPRPAGRRLRLRLPPSAGRHPDRRRRRSSTATTPPSPAPSWSGFVNTLIVAFIGIVVATIIGFVMGVARLSRNWLVSKIATFYVETVRNIPLLLQLLLVYAIILHILPQPRESASLLGLVILNTGGLYRAQAGARNRASGSCSRSRWPILIAIPLLLRIAEPAPRPDRPELPGRQDRRWASWS